MAMMPETREALARYDEWVARIVKSPEVAAARANRLKRRGRELGRRFWRMTMGVFAVLIAALTFGVFVQPLGFGGVILTMLLAIFTMLLLARYPRTRDPTVEALPATALPALPAQVEDWLDSQRRALPAPASRDIDRIMVQLDALSPQLAKLDPASPMADEARRLIGDHLPRLVRTYTQVPASHRATPEATAHLREGLKVVGSEIERMTTTIAREKMDALEVEGRFLESRYRADLKDNGVKEDGQ